MELHYCLTEERLENGLTDYGIEVCLKGERASVPHITTVRAEAVRLLAAVKRGGVTPTALKDIVEDWLLR